MRRLGPFHPRWNTATASGERVPRSMVELLAALRAAYLTYRNAHWQVQGEGYYGNHLLLQRIYEEASEHVDSVAERMVGYYGPAAVDLDGLQAERMQAWIAEFQAGEGPLERALLAAHGVRRALDDAYAELKASGGMSLGLDDLIMSISSDKDEHAYLLQQALDGHEVKLVPRYGNPEAQKRRLLK